MDLDKAENATPKAHQEDGEFIETILLPFNDMLKTILGTPAHPRLSLEITKYSFLTILSHRTEICASRNALCDAKLYTFAWARQSGF